MLKLFNIRVYLLVESKMKVMLNLADKTHLNFQKKTFKKACIYLKLKKKIMQYQLA